MLKRLLSVAFLVIVSAALIIPFLKLREVYQVSEGREGVVVNAMRTSGKLILPLRHDILVPSKPPLFHWLGYSLSKISNSYTEFQLRLPSAIAGILLLVGVFYFTAARAGNRAGLFAAGIMLSTNGFMLMASDGRVDMLCCFFLTSAIFCWLSGLARYPKTEEIPRAVYRQTAILCGLAVLTKGPIGFVLPLIVMAAVLVYERGVRSLRLLLSAEWLWTLGISLPWYLAATFYGRSAFLGRQVFFENFHRFFGGEGITVKPITFYLGEFWLHAAPWSLVFAAYFICAGWAKFKKRESGFLWPADEQKRLVMRSCLIWVVSLTIFLSLSAGKRSAYLLTILAPISVFLAIVADNIAANVRLFSDEYAGTRRKLFWTSTVLLLLTLLGGGVFAAGLAMQSRGWNVPGTAAMRDVMTASTDAVRGSVALYVSYFCILFFLAIALWEQGFAKKRISLLFGAIFCFLQIYLVVFENIGQAARGKTHGYKQFASEVSARVPAGEKLTFVKKPTEESFDGFFFYMQRTVQLFTPSTESAVPTEPGWYLARAGWLNDQENSWSSRVSRVFTGGRRVDEPDRKAVLFKLSAEGEISKPEIIEAPAAPFAEPTPVPQLSEPQLIEPQPTPQQSSPPEAAHIESDEEEVLPANSPEPESTDRPL